MVVALALCAHVETFLKILLLYMEYTALSTTPGSSLPEYIVTVHQHYIH